jgi:hypothetical protein
VPTLRRMYEELASPKTITALRNPLSVVCSIVKAAGADMARRMPNQSAYRALCSTPPLIAVLNPILRLLRAAVLQGQVASVSCFGPVPSCYWLLVGRPTGPRLIPFSSLHPVTYGETFGAGLWPVSCFFLSFTGVT